MISRLKSMILGNWGGRVLLTSVVVSGLILSFRQLGVFQGAELRNYDSLISGRKDKAPDDRLLVVKITEPDLKSLQEPFVYDETLADAINKLQQYQPTVIALDIDRSIPMPKVPKGQKREKLEKALQSPNVVAVCALSGLEFEGFPPPPEINTNQVGFADIPEDPDGVMRRSLLIASPPPTEKDFEVKHFCNDPQGGDRVSFAFLTSMIYLQSLDVPVESTEEENPRIKIGNTIVNRLTNDSGGYQGQEMGTYSILIDYRHPIAPSQTVTLGELLNDKVDPQLVKDKIIVIGYDTIAIPDTFLTPFSQGLEENARMPGMILHAQIISQLLSMGLDGQKPIGYAPQPIEWLWIITWSAIGGFVTFKGFKQLWLVAIVDLGAIGILFLIVKLAMGGASLWLPLTPSLVALILTTVGVILIDRIPTVQKMLKISIEIDWEQVRKEADKLVSLSGGVSATKKDVELIQEDLEVAQQKAKQSYLEELQKRAKERRKKKHTPSTPATPIIAPAVKVETEENLYTRLQDKMLNLKQRLSSRRGKEKPVIESSTSVTSNISGNGSGNVSGNGSGQTLEQQAEIQRLERYIEEVLNNARTIRQQVEK